MADDEGVRTPLSSAMIAAAASAKQKQAPASGKRAIDSADPATWFGPQQPIQPMAPDGTGGRQWDYPFGENLNYSPRGTEQVTFAMLRNLADSLPILRIVIEKRKDQIAGWSWDIQPRLTGKDRRNPLTTPSGKQDPRISDVRRFFTAPDRRHSFHTWLRMLLEDMLVIDAACIFPRKTRGGGLYSLDVVDGSTVKPLIDGTGRPPLPDDGPAYQQILHGIPAADFTLDELRYLPRNVRSNRLYGQCFGPGTEILTRDGWKPVAGVAYEDQLATRHPVTHEFQWQSPIAITTRRFSGDLVHFYNGNNGIDILVTPEHKMIVQSKYSGCETLMPADELARKPLAGCRWKIPLAADSWNGIRIVEKVFANHEALARNDVIRGLRVAGATYQRIADEVGCHVSTVADVVTGRYTYDGRGSFRIDRLSGDDFCAFMGMYLSEGSIAKGQAVVISQIKPATTEKFKAKLTQCFGPVEYDGREFRIHRQRVVDYVTQFGRQPNRFVPDEIMNATSEQIAVFLEYLFDGDGHRSKKGQTFYYTTSERMAGQVQELCQKIGRPASVRSVIQRGSVMADGRVIKAENCRTLYIVSVNRTRFSSVMSERVPYSGDVHCVSVPNKSVLVRRNGKAAWTSQSPVESVALTVNISLRREVFNLEYYNSSSLPEAFGTLPKEWSVDQIKGFQDYFDTLLSGQLAARRKLRFMPADFKMQEVRSPPLKDQYDEWLARIICAAFSIPASAFVSDVNRATAQQIQISASQEGIEPLQNWIKDWMDTFIQADLGHDDLEFVWSGVDKTDPLLEAQTNQIYVAIGAKSVDEVRVELGLDPYGIGPTVAQQPVPLKESYDQAIENIKNPPPPPVAAAPAAADGQDDGKGGNPPPKGAEAASEAPVKEAAPPKPAQSQNAQNKAPAANKAADSSPATLYVSRPLLNGDALIAWAKDQGFATTLPADDMHVTIGFSRTPFDHGDLAPKGGKVLVVGGSRSMEQFGEAVVLRFDAPQLADRWQELVDAGASWDFEGYKPHVTITYAVGDVDLDEVEPYDGPLVFGGEVFKPVKEDWQDGVKEASASAAEVAKRGGAPFRSLPPLDLDREALKKPQADMKAVWQRILARHAKAASSAITAIRSKIGKADGLPDPDVVEHPSGESIEISNLLEILTATLALDINEIERQKIEAALADGAVDSATQMLNQIVEAAPPPAAPVETPAAPPEPTALIEPTARIEPGTLKPVIVPTEPPAPILPPASGAIIEPTSAVVATEAETAEVGVTISGDIFDRINTDAVEWAAQHAGELISSVSDTTREAVRKAMAEGLSTGESYLDLIERVKALGVFSDARSELIAETELRLANSMGSLNGMLQARAMGVALKKGWLTAALVLERVCEVCRGNERASPIELDATFPSGDMTPPGHPNACFAGTSFAPYGGLRNLFRARYDGPAITIEAEILQDGVEATSGDSSCSDNRLAVNIPSEQFSNLGNLSGCDFLRVPVPVAPDRVVITIGPNHPMLTRRGWVKARDIQDGDELLYDSRVEFVAGAVNPDLEKVPPFEDIFSSLTSVLGYTRVAGPAYYFHGDEAFVYGEVNAVGSARGLLTVLDPGGLEHVSEDDFSRSDPDLASLAPYGVSATLLERIFLEARGSMRRGKHGGSLMLSGARPSNFHRARVTRHESTSFVGFAFDAETDSGIYNAGGFVVKNCRCALLPVVVDETTEKSAPSRFVCEAEKSFSPSEARGPDGKWIGGAGFIIASSKAEQKAMLQANWAKHGRALDYDDIFESHPGLFEREAKLWNKKHGTNIDGENYHFGSNRDFEAHFEAQHLDGKIAPFPGVKEANDFFENQDGHGPSHAVYLRGQEPA